MIVNFNKGIRRKENKKYNNICSYIYKTKIAKNINKDRIKQLRKQQYETPRYDYNDPNFKRLSYVRYADDFILGVIGSKNDTVEIMNNIVEYLANTLKIEVNKDKTRIIHNKDKVRFLGYDLTVMKNDKRKEINGGIALWLPYEVIKNYIIKNRFGKFINDKISGKTQLKAIHRSELLNITELEILMQYNIKMRGLYNYYKMASNVCKLNNFNYICQLSFLRTLAAKYKTTCKKLCKNKNYCRNKKIGITHNNHFYEFFNGPFTVVKNIKYEKNIDVIETINQYFNRTSLIDRMSAHKCEFCGDEEGPFEVHHIKKLKDLKGKTRWEKLMIARKRKTMVLCVTCHDKLHAGKL